MFSFGCIKCNGSGFVVTTNRKNKCLYAFVCPCPFGRSKKVSDGFPVWRDSHFKEFEPDDYAPIFPDPKSTALEPEKKIPDDVPF